MPNYFRGINVTNKPNKFIRRYIQSTSEFFEMPDGLTGKHAKFIRDISAEQVQDAIRKLFSHYYN